MKKNSFSPTVDYLEMRSTPGPIMTTGPVLTPDPPLDIISEVYYPIYPTPLSDPYNTSDEFFEMMKNYQFRIEAVRQIYEIYVPKGHPIIIEAPYYDYIIHN